MTLYADAGSTHNGFEDNVSHICVHDGEQILHHEIIGNRTINEAEMLAIAKAVEIADGEPSEIYSDSMLAVNILNHDWKAKKPHLKVLRDSIQIPETVQLEWISREDNPAGWYLELNHGI